VEPNCRDRETITLGPSKMTFIFCFFTFDWTVRAMLICVNPRMILARDELFKFSKIPNRS
jgi:hypothetical protein